VALPTTIEPGGDISFRGPSSQGRIRPYISSAGNVYLIMFTSGDALIGVFKATDPTDSFTFLSTATVLLANSGAEGQLATFQDGDDVHVATQDDNEAILYHVFSMSSDTWTTSNEAVTSAVGTDVNADKAISISLETGGDIILFYQGASDNDMGQKERVDRAWKTGGSWVVDQAVDEGGAVSYFLGGVVRGEADKFHLVYKDDTGPAFEVEHRSVQDVDGTLSAVDRVNDSSVEAFDFVIPSPVFYDDGGIERITVAWHASTPSAIKASEIDDDATPGAEEGVASAPHTNGEFTVVSLAVDLKEVWLLYADSTTQDLFSHSNNNSAGWSGGEEELDAVTINLVTSNVYTRQNEVKLAYVYDDGGTIKYNEKILRTVPPLIHKRKLRTYLRM